MAYACAMEEGKGENRFRGVDVPSLWEVFAPFSMPRDLQAQSLHSFAMLHQTLSNAANRAAMYFKYVLSCVVL